MVMFSGLVSKLQAEQKSFSGPKRIDSRPNSGRATSDKVRIILSVALLVPDPLSNFGNLFF